MARLEQVVPALAARVRRANPWNGASLALFVLLFGLVLLTFQDYGISWDEQVQNIYGRDLLSYYASAFRDQSAFNFINLRYYGGLFDMLAALANKISPFGEYETRHLVGGLFALLGFAGVWRLARLIGNARAAFFAVLLLALTPLIAGHSFINPKDAPFAWTMVWAIYFACRIAGELPKPSFGAVAGFGVCTGLALATRIGGLLAMIYLLGAVLVYAGRRLRESRRLRPVAGEMLRVSLRLVPAAALAYLVMALFWPWAVQSPLNPIKALSLFSNFPWQGQILWAGEYVSPAHLPRSYLATLLVVQLPEIVLAGLLFAGLGLVRFLRMRGGGAALQARGLQIFIVAEAAFLPLLAFALLTPESYNGLRHFLFVVPPLIILSALGFDALFGLLWRRQRVAFYAASAALALITVRQAAVLIDLHPYEYVYYNSLTGGVSGAKGRFELDYWGVSLAEASKDLGRYVQAQSPRLARPLRAAVCGDWLSAAYFLPASIHYTGSLSDADFYIALNDEDCPPQRGKRIIGIHRDGALLSYVEDLRAPR